MESDLAQEAIDAALAGDWQKAILINSKILKINSTDVDALNRIARAYAETGDLPKAKKASQKVIKIDSTNSIATRCFAKWNNYTRSKGSKNIASLKASPDAFIEEPNKTKIVNLINLGDIKTIMCLSCGDVVVMSPHLHRVNIVTEDDKYIGRFPDDLAAKFIKLIKFGNVYDVLIKSASEESVKVFVIKAPKNVY